MKHKNRSLILILLTLACIVLLATGTFAAYTNLKYVKRVVTTKPGADDLRFSSNYLDQLPLNTDPDNQKLINVGQNSSASIGVTVCNYPQNDSTRFSDSTISYTLKVTLIDSSGNEVTEPNVLEMVEIQKGNDENDIHHPNYTFSNQSLTGGQASENLYTITCASDNISTISEYLIRMEAIADGFTEKLVGDFAITPSSAEAAGWSGGFIEDAPSNTLDAFNYVISGSAQRNITLTWDPQYVTISKWSVQDLGLNYSPDRESITFQVGGPGQPSRYQFQFYRTNGIPDDETWDTVAEKKYVDFNQEPISTDNNNSG